MPANGIVYCPWTVMLNVNTHELNRKLWFITNSRLITWPIPVSSRLFICPISVRFLSIHVSSVFPSFGCLRCFCPQCTSASFLFPFIACYRTVNLCCVFCRKSLTDVKFSVKMFSFYYFIFVKIRNIIIFAHDYAHVIKVHIVPCPHGWRRAGNDIRHDNNYKQMQSRVAGQG